MIHNIRIWIQARYHGIINSIAFYPAFIGLLFLMLSSLTIALDFSETGKEIKSQLSWLRLKDASTARSIISAIAAGIISLAVFSFSMVMIVLNQAASQLSNRVLDKLIGNRFQQIVLGIYIGTIVYALFVLSTIRDIDSGIYVPALSTYLLILITISDIFLFIYFLHYITQSVKYEVIIQRIYTDTKASLEQSCRLDQEPSRLPPGDGVLSIAGATSGIYQGFNRSALLALADKYDFTIYILHPPGTFVLRGVAVAQVNKQLPQQAVKGILDALIFSNGETIEANFISGFRQLMEVALKALSPGVNDPGTAIQSMRALFRLLSYRVCYFPDNVVRNKDNKIRIVKKDLGFRQIFSETVLPIWDYGKKDRLLRLELLHLMVQLQVISADAAVGKLMHTVRHQIEKQRDK